jgi:hypothetical protein
MEYWAVTFTRQVRIIGVKINWFTLATISYRTKLRAHSFLTGMSAVGHSLPIRLVSASRDVSAVPRKPTLGSSAVSVVTGQKQNHALQQSRGKLLGRVRPQEVWSRTGLRDSLEAKAPVHKGRTSSLLRHSCLVCQLRLRVQTRVDTGQILQ